MHFNPKNGGLKIYIEYDDCESYNRPGAVGHYNAIVNMRGYMGLPYYCEECHVAYHHRHKHRCKGGCKLCYAPVACEPVEEQREEGDDNAMTFCTECNRWFVTPTCYAQHIANQVCTYRRQCAICEREYYRDEQHVCDELKCHVCNTFYLEEHDCYMKPLRLERLKFVDKKYTIYVFYDIESTQVKCDASGGVYFHRPNLLMCNIVCDYCWDPARLCKRWSRCNKCGDGNKEFIGDKCVLSFVSYVCKQLGKIAQEQSGKVIVFAHNARGYDAHFIMTKLAALGYTDMRPIMYGNKILRLDIHNVRFIDSLSFFMQPLAVLPKAFTLEEKIKKGFFPHRFNKIKYWNYKGDIP